MTTKINVFITGATGYLGGSVLQRLLAHPERTSFSITALVRNVEKAKLLEEFCVKTTIGSYSDLDKLEAAASTADVFFAIANCDDLPAAKAILQGLKKRHAETGKQPILIHTSGSAIIIDNAQGKYASDNAYSDMDIPRIEALDPAQPHRNVDIAIVEASKEGYARTHIVVPPTIFGRASGPLFEKGICNPGSIQIPSLIQVAWHRKASGLMGEGKNLWSLVSVDDVADLYIVLFDAARKDEKTAHGREGFYFAENGYYQFYEAAKAISDALVQLGRTDKAEPTPWTQEQLGKYFAGAPIFGTNSLCKADRARALGWKPTKTKKDFLDSIKPEAEALIKEGRIDDAFWFKTVFLGVPN
ncbi:NAD P-binding protein [Gloeophyllum trabeum ATCC 11539]|uniref:NAD P-binding protein n=1 Tax=Gloeophyllum trabeum (strain ATCC 11539 / FP-39264 / Madison 617) TaxID=670483 RepID=S7PYK7_GLOTA|nr:NAD P-binding protein [Gloeophyllum trabeum ATCC 11539]EPQ52538.1 NAD P-binding protein [Gloeophyllum trabeum ATCC 11539]